MKIRGKIAIPADKYVGEFISVEETDHPDFGAGLMWAFMVVGGKFDGQIACRTTGDVATDKNACGRMFKSVTGSAWHPESDNDPAPFLGKRYHVIVEDAPSGTGTRVASAIAVRDESVGSDEPPF